MVEVLASEARLSKEWHFGWYASFVGFDFVAEPISECHYNKNKYIINYLEHLWINFSRFSVLSGLLHNKFMRHNFRNTVE